MYDRFKIIVSDESNKDILQMFVASAQRLNIKNGPGVKQG